MRVRIHHLSMGFRSIRGHVSALKDISMEIENGEFFVLLGPSGSGKSTLLNLISGLETPTQGEIWFDGMLAASHAKGVCLSPKERNVAFVFQSYALYPHMNVFQNIAFPLKIRGTVRERIRESVERTASLLEISDLLSAKPGELSGGQRQRVAIARAIVRHPNIFLLDEPLSNLDPQLRLSMRTELKKIQRSLGVTTIYVTHDQTEAMSLGDRIAVLRSGEIEQIGTPDELYESPRNPFVAAFIGSPSMNLIRVPFSEEKGGFFILIAGNRLQIPQDKSGALKELNERECTLGIRPEHILITPKETDSSIETEVISVESLGRDKVILVARDDVRLYLLSDEKGIKEGDRIRIELDLNYAHIFKA
ncbi:MAG: ABC transporter ATP-binding protein [bacterium]